VKGQTRLGKVRIAIDVMSRLIKNCLKERLSDLGIGTEASIVKPGY
jgi:hypothetical protein